MEIDTSELRALAADLRGAGDLVGKHVNAVVSRGALNIKNQLRREMRDSRHFRPVASAISYDIHRAGFSSGDVIEAEIGPERGSPGSLANIAFFGTSRGGGTVPDPQGALDAEAPRFEKALSDLFGDLL